MSKENFAGVIEETGVENRGRKCREKKKAAVASENASVSDLRTRGPDERSRGSPNEREGVQKKGLK